MKHPFRAAIIGVAGCGKTILTKQIVDMEEFDYIWIVEPSFTHLGDWKESKYMMVNSIRDVINKTLCSEFKHLIIMDEYMYGDKIDANDFLRLNSLFNASIIIVSHLYGFINKCIRVNLTNLFLFNCKNPSELKKLREEIAFFDKYNDETKSYMHIDFKEHIFSGKRFKYKLT